MLTSLVVPSVRDEELIAVRAMRNGLFLGVLAWTAIIVTVIC